jgi:uncharacterized membrane protein YedE/YeeE
LTRTDLISGLLGGSLIGVAATLLLAWNGRIAGISGLLGGLVRPTRGDVLWRALFLIGLVAGATPWFALSPRDSFQITAHLPLLLAGGFLVGFGTQLGNGCTSGHGVCGIARGSRRSLVATLTFMLTGATTVFVLRHLLGVQG